jgi:nucleoside 2-deoxyribosyltransferase
MKPIVYLAGPVLGQTAVQAMMWREHCADIFDDCGIRAISPVRAERPVNSLRFTAGDDKWRGVAALGAKCWFDVKRADAVLAYLPDSDDLSIGTVIEIGWAKALEKPVVLVTNDEVLKAHPILRWCCVWIEPSIDDGVLRIEELLGGYTAGGKNV